MQISETIWFKNDDPRLYANPDNFRIEEFHSQQHRLPEFIPPAPCETVDTIKTSLRNMGRDVVHHQRYPQLKQFYSLTEKFLYRYNYKFTLRRKPSLDHVVARASQDTHAFKAYNHEMFQLSFNFLHPTPKDVQCNNFKVHETKLVHNLIYYTYLRDNLPHKNFIYNNDQMTSPYFLKFAYTINNKYMRGTLRNFYPVKNYYIFHSIDNLERPLMVPIEALEPVENYHTYHIQGSVPVKPIKKFIEYIGSRRPTEQEKKRNCKKR